MGELYRQGGRQVHHGGTFEERVEQLCSRTPEDRVAPARLDALVLEITDLLVTGPGHLTGW